MTNDAPCVALVGNPNAGKTSLFNRLTGLRQRVGNYPGVTVDRVEGQVRTASESIRVIDLPGTYSMSPLSPDEEVTSGVLQGTLDGVRQPDGVVLVVDVTTLKRSLAFVAEVLACGIPTLVVLTMIDELKRRGGKIDIPKLERRLGTRVVGVVGNRGLGIDDVRHELASVTAWDAPWGDLPTADTDADGRFAWASRIADACFIEPTSRSELSDRIDGVLLHPVFGLLVFFALMVIFFQVVFTVAAPLQDLFEGAVLALGELAAGVIPPGLAQSLIVDGIISGVGGVVVFVPQIALLLLMIAIMEGTGYMGRAAFLVDSVMGRAGLEGRSFVALLSSYACAVPGVMATRSVPDPVARLTTILVAPLTTCSARLPVYALLISAFVPAKFVFGVFQLQGLVLFGLYLAGALSSLIAAAVLSRGLKTGKTFPFYLELPPYRRPAFRDVMARVKQGVGAFLRKAGTIILAAAVILWALMSFPMHENATGQLEPPPLEESFAGTIGHAVEPLVEPLGYDWKIAVGLIGSFAAREVIVSTMSQIYSIEATDEDAELASLGERLQSEQAADGTARYSLATALSLMVFFIYALMCVSTLAIIRRETHSWRWPAIAFGYTFVLAYGGAFLTHRVASALGF